MTKTREEKNEIFAAFGKALLKMKKTISEISESASEVEIDMMLDAVKYELSVLRNEKI